MYFANQANVNIFKNFEPKRGPFCGLDLAENGDRVYPHSTIKCLFKLQSTGICVRANNTVSYNQANIACK